MKKIVKSWPQERVDLRDWEDAVGALILSDQCRQHRTAWLPSGRSTAGATTTFSARIFDGFNVSDIAGAVFRINRGSGLFQYLLDGELTMGLMAGDEGDAYQVVDISALAAGVWEVWVRFALADSDTENRVFWDGVSAEYVDFVESRQTMTWSYQILAAGAPAPAGGDWVRIWTVTLDAYVAITANADRRHLFFEGYAGTGADQWAAEWGTADDRNAARGTYGVKDLHKFVSAVRQKFTEIQGGAWYIAPDPDLTDLAVEHKTTGAHGDVNADRILLASGSALPLQWMLPVAPAGSYPSRPVLRWHTKFTAPIPEQFRLEEWGRLASTHRFADDFMYPYGGVWGVADHGPHYVSTITGSGLIRASGIRAGGVALFTTDINGNKVCELRSNAAWQCRSAVPTNLTRVFMFYRGYVDVSGTPNTGVLKIGFGTGAAGVYRAWWELDKSGTNLWTLKCDDGAGGTGSDASAYTKADVGDMMAWIMIDPWAGGAVGKIEGQICIAGGALETVEINPLPGAGATFTDPFAMQMRVDSGADAQSETGELDYWEAWDELLHSST